MADVLHSPLLAQHGFAHGFSLRTGGVSAPPYDTLNLGRAVGDAPEAVEANHAAFAAEVGYPAGALYELSQIHGAAVRVPPAGEPPERVRQEEGDALVVARPGAAVAVRVADCVSVLMADPRSGAVAAVHAGWRGTVAGVVAAAVATLERVADTRPEELLVALGPHIRVGAFEVGEDVATRIAAAAPGLSRGEVVQARRPRPHVDLSRVLRAQLAALGVASDRVEDVGGCTFDEPARFFSFRRDGRASGRHLGAIVARARG